MGILSDGWDEAREVDRQLAAANQRIAELEGRLGMAIVYEIPYGEKGRFVIRRCSCHRCYGKEDGGWTLIHDTKPAFLIPNAPSISIMTVMQENGRFGNWGGGDAHFPTADAAFAALAARREEAVWAAMIRECAGKNYGRCYEGCLCAFATCPLLANVRPVVPSSSESEETGIPPPPSSPLP